MVKNERLLIFVDEANVTRAASKNFNKNFDWLKFRNYLIQETGLGRDLVEMVLYVGLPPSTPEWQHKQSEKMKYVYWLKSQGFLVYEKKGQPRENNWYKANVDVIMAIDAVELTIRIKPDVVILVTGDADFAHLAYTIRRQGVKVEVAAIPQIMAAELRIAANKFIDLTDLFTTFDTFESAFDYGQQRDDEMNGNMATANGSASYVPSRDSRRWNGVRD